MKFIHISDLHLGKRVYEYPMNEEQEYILNQILEIIEKENPDGVLIAGDIYDKPIPPAEAVKLFDDFLVRLADRKTEVFVIGGNHDSIERIAFGARLMSSRGVHISPVYNGEILPVTMNDGHGKVNVFMLPFVKPAHVRGFCDEEIYTYTDAIRSAISVMDVNPSERNILVAHQFVTGATRCESEEVSVGGLDNVDASVFEVFDYIALGHIHSPQNCGSPKIRYCGSPLKYSFSEAKDKKSVTVVELLEKGNTVIRTAELKPRHELVELKGKYEELTLKSFYENTAWQEDYTHITLTDEDDIPDAVSRLRTIYHRLMKLDYDNKRTRMNIEINGTDSVEAKTPDELFADFYLLQNNQPMSDEQAEFMKELIEKTSEDKQ